MVRAYHLREAQVRVEGEVSWFNEQKGFGFITLADGRDVFVHYTEIVRDGFQTLEAGEKVTLSVIDEEVGPKASEVRLKDDGKRASLL
ncbi:MAG: cold shock domain-containing protein [Desulfovibrionaceae bacterium]|nr:cold shock domain-containing protein [Desulfovibrionaceae bacterium]